MKKNFLLLASAVVFAGFTAFSCKADKSAEDTASNTETEFVESGKVSDSEININITDTSVVAEGQDNPEAQTANSADKYASAKVDHEGYKTTPSGLMYKEVKKGTGAKPSSANAIVKVHYTGKKLDGTEFDSSYTHGQPIEFPLNRVIPGWTEGVQLMNTGAKYQFIIPSNLAYGPQGTPGGPIGPNEDLYFEVELLEVK
ncbi:MAG: FKBP-type peptidyl-prolyl cis-trans isomerase [Prevotella sp.]|nr:FKBP-type peptidyl-prolyl cis-trans isomerase [Prevotella sp.]MCM1074528.1 FKBP-type peptidyl-prolyl cis-trans isomerase [Ruminococcus sp.]